MSIQQKKIKIKNSIGILKVTLSLHLTKKILIYFNF